MKAILTGALCAIIPFAIVFLGIPWIEPLYHKYEKFVASHFEEKP